MGEGDDLAMGNAVSAHKLLSRDILCLLHEIPKSTSSHHVFHRET